MPRTPWFDDKVEHPVIQEHIKRLESFTSALTDGVVSKSELSGQEQRLMTAMKKVEVELSDDLHLKVDRKSTRLNSSHIQKSRMPSSA